MKYSGALILVFVVLHVMTFKYGPYYPVAGSEGTEIRDLAKLMQEVFSSWGYFTWYIVAMLFLALHLAHALWSSLQTLGLIPVGKEKGLRCLSLAFGWIIALGFAANPIYIFLFGG